jgi:hypothetical protein
MFKKLKVKKVKNPIDAIKDELKKTTGAVNKIENILKCPVNVVSNFPTCGWFYMVDMMVWVFHLLPFFISFFTIYIPLQIILWIIILINRGNLKISFFKNALHENSVLRKFYILDIDTFTVTKLGFANVIENIFYYLSGGNRLISRSSSDISKCYCISPLTWIFQPLRKFQPFGKTISNQFSFLNMPFMAFLIIAMIFIPYFMNK